MPSFLPLSIHTGWGWGIWLAGSSLVLCPCKRAGREGGHVTALTVVRKTLFFPHSMFPRHCTLTHSVLILLACPAPFSHTIHYPGSSLLLQSSSIRSYFPPYNRPFFPTCLGGWKLSQWGLDGALENRVSLSNQDGPIESSHGKIALGTKKTSLGVHPISFPQYSSFIPGGPGDCP